MIIELNNFVGHRVFLNIEHVTHISQSKTWNHNLKEKVDTTTIYTPSGKIVTSLKIEDLKTKIFEARQRQRDHQLLS